MSKSELLNELHEAILFQINEAEQSLKANETEQFSAFTQRAQVLYWAQTRLQCLDSLE